MIYAKTIAVLVAAAGILALASLGSSVTVDKASAHRNGCHPKYTCPSDHATYRWRGRAGGRLGNWLCVHATSEERNASFRIRVRYGGRTYFCKR